MLRAPRLAPVALALFALGDFAAGAASDASARNVGRFGRWLAVAGLLSCAAFLLLPQATSPALLLALIVLWVICSSALRAPVMALVGKHAPAPRMPLLVSMSQFGLGVAGASASSASWRRGPRWPLPAPSSPATLPRSTRWSPASCSPASAGPA
jgi:MFS family permease